jgi:hypothetical protein
MGGVESHYSVRDIEARILAALRVAGLNPDQRLSPVELGALDHFHTGGFRASPGGRFAFQEMAAGEGAATYFPLPWATDPADNLLLAIGEMREVLARSGFAPEYFEDVSEAPLPPPADGTPDSAPQAPLSLSVYVDNLAEKAENAARSLRERQIRLVRGVFLA